MFRSDPPPLPSYPFPVSFCLRCICKNLMLTASSRHHQPENAIASGGHLMAGLRGWSHWGGAWPWTRGVCSAQPSRVQSTSSTANATFCFPAINFDHALNPPYSGHSPFPHRPLLALLSHGFFIRTFLEKSVEQELAQGQGQRRTNRR